MLTFITQALERRKQSLENLQPQFDEISGKFEQVANLHEFKYASELRELCRILTFELYQKAPQSQVEKGSKMAKSLDAFKEGRNALILKLGEQNEDVLVKTALSKLSD